MSEAAIETDDTLSHLHAAILARPGDDDPRLRFADRLDERAGSVPCPGGCRIPTPRTDGKYRVYESGGPDSRWVVCSTCRGSGSVPDGLAARAAFIRVQCELARLLGSPCPILPDANNPGASCYYAGCPRCVPTAALRRRERGLLDNERPAADMPGWRVSNRVLWFAGDGGDSIARTVAFDPQYTRGFVSAVTLSAADLVQHMDTVLASQPIEAVTLTTMPEVETEVTPPGVRGRIRFVGEEWWVAFDPAAGDRRAVEGLLRCRWPGITFTLPMEWDER